MFVRWHHLAENRGFQQVIHSLAPFSGRDDPAGSVPQKVNAWR